MAFTNKTEKKTNPKISWVATVVPYSCDFMVVFNYIFLSTTYVVKKYLGTQ